MDTAMRLKPSPLRSQLHLVGLSAIFVAIPLFIHDHSAIAWICITLFGAGLTVFALNLIPGSSLLQLTPEAMTIRSIYRDHQINWPDIAEFFVAPIGGRQMVCWNYSPSYDKRRKFRALSRGLAGVDAGLPDTYGYSAEGLAQLLNQWRSKYGGARPN